MGKFLALLVQKTRSLIRKSPLVFAVFMLVQVVTVFSYLFFYSTVVKNRTDYIAHTDGMRRISVSLSSVQRNQAFVQAIRQNGMTKPAQITFYFTSDASTSSKHFWAFLYPEKESGGISGKAITQQDIRNAAMVVIPANNNAYDEPDRTHHEVHTIGDTVDVGSDHLSAKGIRHAGYLDEIPYTTGFAHFRLTGFDFVVPAGLTDTEKQQLGGYFTAKLGASNVRLPKPIAQKVLSSLFFPLLASVLIGVIAVINFLFLYRYMVEQCRRDFTLLRLCGCPRSKSLGLLFAQLVFLFTAAYLFSLALLLLLRTAGAGAFAQASIGLAGCAAVYLTFIGFILLAMLPVAFRFLKKSIIEDEEILA